MRLCSRFTLAALSLTVIAGRSPQTPSSQPRPPAGQAADAAGRSRSPSRSPTQSPEVRGDGRRLRVEDRGEADQRAGDDDGDQSTRRSRARRRRISPSCCARCRASTSRRSPRATSTSRRAARPARWRPSQLALLDGRSLYQDFFGFVMWDFLPVNLNEIKQIEVIRGPASAVWGANALNGVVNVITKSPREMQGTSVHARRRRVRSRRPTGNGAERRHALLHQRHARAGGQRSVGLQDLRRRLHAGSATASHRHRSRATVPRSAPDAQRRIRRYKNQGTTQPKFDARVDYDSPDGAKLSFSGGVAGTDGIMQSGIGPFNINNGSVLGYGKVELHEEGVQGRRSSPTSSTATPTTC